MLKKLAMAIALFFLIGCSGVQVAETKAYTVDNLPMAEITDPNVKELVMSILGQGHKLLGATTDAVNAWLLYFSINGECVAILADPEHGTIDGFPSCEYALEIWQECHDTNGSCYDPAEKI